MSRFTQVLLVSPLDDGNTWALMRSFGYAKGSEDSGKVIDVPVGFLTDFTSVPWFFQWWIPKWGRYGNAAVIHDWLYWCQRYPRWESDFVFLEAMGVMGVGTVKKYAIFYGVRAFGWWAWLRNQEDLLSGFDRVLQQPDLKAGAKSLRRGSLHQIFKAVLRRAKLTGRKNK